MANGTSFVDSQIQNVNELQLDWLQFSRHVFHFQKSLQLQQNYMGGSPTYFKSVQDVSAFCYGYLAADSSERIVVENWLDLHKKVSSCVMEMMSQLSAEERSQMAAQAKELRDMCDDSLSSVHLARLNHLPLTEMERRCMGGIINLVPEMLEQFSRFLYDLQFIRQGQLSLHRGEASMPGQGPGNARGSNLPSLQSIDPNSYGNDTAAKAEFTDRTNEYLHNQTTHRGLPFHQWKLSYLKL